MENACSFWGWFCNNHDALRSLAFVFGAIAGPILASLGVYLANRRVVATEQQLVISTDNLFADTFARGVELLAHEKLHMRIAGIRTLEHLLKGAGAIDENKGLILEVLVDHVRTAKLSEISPEDSIASIQLTRRKTHSDIEVALRVLGWINSDNESFDFDLQQQDLRGLQLAGIQLVSAKLSRAKLDGAELNEANFKGSNISSTKFNGASMRNVNFENISGNHAKFIAAILWKASLVKSKLRWCAFNDAYIREVDFSESDLMRSDFENANCEGSVFVSADLKNTNFSMANISDCDFKDAKNMTQKQLNESIYREGHEPKNLPRDNNGNHLSVNSKRVYKHEVDEDGNTNRYFVESEEPVRPDSDDKDDDIPF